MKILILAVHYEVTGARYIADAFTRLGHDVKHDGRLANLEDAWGTRIDPKYRWASNCTCTWELTVSIKDWKPDLIIIADTATVGMINEIHPDFIGIPIIIWTQDNHVRNVRRDGIAHYFLAHKHGPAHPVRLPDETWLPCAVDAAIFTPSPIDWSSRKYDVALVGVQYPRRVALAKKLRAEGFNVLTATGLLYDEYRDAYQNSRISLCVSAARDVAQRVFETAAMGCVVLSDPLLDIRDEATNHDLGLQGYFFYNTDDECVAMVRDLLTTDSAKAQFGAARMQDIVRTGQTWVRDADGNMQRVKVSKWENHTWDARCRVVVDWYQANYGGDVATTTTGVILNDDGTVKDTPLNIGKRMPDGTSFAVGDMSDPTALNNKPIKVKPYLNLGCGTTHFPSAKPAGHELVDDAVYAYPKWVNVDKVEGVGADKTFDLFTYPWPLEDNSFDGAVLAHLVEHIPHEIKIAKTPSRLIRAEMDEQYPGMITEPSDDEIKDLDNLRMRFEFLSSLQDGWYAFFSELYRVLTPNAIAHIVSPYGFSDGGITDPSHTRYLTMNTFTHSMTPSISDGATFRYNNGGINFVIEGQPQYRLVPYAGTLKKIYESLGVDADYDFLMGTHLNVCYDFHVMLKAVK